MHLPGFFANASIKRKLTMVVMFTSGFALLIACAAFMAYDVYTSRQRMATDLALVAEGLAINVTPALDFQDPRGAEDVLRSLRARSNVVAARVLGNAGEPFASYEREPKGGVVLPPRHTPGINSAHLAAPASSAGSRSRRARSHRRRRTGRRWCWTGRR